MNAARPKRFQRAVMEFTLIVAGVLTALAVDEWRADMSDQQLERSYLERLERDLLSDSASFLPQGFFDRRAQLLGRLRTADEGLRSGEMTVDSVASIIARSTQTGWYFSPATSATFDELRSTGAFNLVRSVELRAAISGYYLSRTIRQSTVQARVSRFPAQAYELVPRTASGDFRVGELTGGDRERILDAVSNPGFLGLVNAEANRNLYQARAHRGMEGEVAYLLGEIRDYAEELGVTLARAGA